jgi:predicted transcriptional regulator
MANHVFYVSAGLLTPEHYRKIDTAIWVFMWLISHETREGGKVLNGSPITIKRIAQELGESTRTVRRHLNHLEAHGYIVRNRIRSGEIYSYSIANSKKWKARTEMAAPEATDVLTPRTNLAAPEAKNGRANKEGRQVDKVDRVDKHTCATDVACERIYQAYPKHVGKAAALKAIGKAISGIQKQMGGTREDAADFLYSQVIKFADSPKGKQGRFTPYPATWMNQGRYFDDPVEWHSVIEFSEGKTNGHAKPDGSHVEYQDPAEYMERQLRQ